jgi:SAM-dependent methyltransferase
MAAQLNGSISSGAEWVGYHVLRSLAHRRALATEEQLNAAAGRITDQDLEDGVRKAQKFIARFKGRMPVDPNLSYLDMGCGTGALTIGLVRLGLRKVTGVDFMARHVERAASLAKKYGVSDRIEFTCADLRSWKPPHRYDVLLSFDAFEHIAQPKAFLDTMKAFIAPNGVAVLAFGPLFHSPFGDHMWPAFRLQIPWRGLLFSEKVMLRLRREFYRPTDAATCYGEVAGGLNLMRYSEFVKWVEETGWQFEFLAVNTFLQPFPLVQRISDALMRVPGVQDYFPHNVYCILRRGQAQRAEPRPS